MKPLTPIEVEWIDCSQRQMWRDFDEIMSPLDLTCKSVGYFLEWRKDCLILCQSITRVSGSKPESVDATIYIPRVAVRKVRRL